MSRAFSASAIARRLVCPEPRIVRDHGREVLRVSIGIPHNGRPERPSALSARLSAAAPFGLPSLTPRLRASASASLARFEIASRSWRAPAP